MFPRPTRSPLAARLLGALLLLVLPPFLPTFPRLGAWLGQTWFLLPDNGGWSQRAYLSQSSQPNQRRQRGDLSQGRRPAVRVTGGPTIGSSVILDPNGGGPSGGSGGAPPAPGPH
jgi:hypothetical protein